MVHLLSTPVNIDSLQICYVMSLISAQLNFFSVGYAHGPIIQLYNSKEELMHAFPHLVPKNLLFYLDKYVYEPENEIEMLREQNEMFYDRLEQHFARFPPLKTSQSLTVDLVDFL